MLCAVRCWRGIISILLRFDVTSFGLYVNVKHSTQRPQRVRSHAQSRLRRSQLNLIFTSLFSTRGKRKRGRISQQVRNRIKTWKRKCKIVWRDRSLSAHGGHVSYLIKDYLPLIKRLINEPGKKSVLTETSRG